MCTGAEILMLEKKGQHFVPLKSFQVNTINITQRQSPNLGKTQDFIGITWGKPRIN